MSEQIEIEYKTMLTKEEYLTLCHTLGKQEEDAYTQTNYYFDTPDYALQSLGCGLRIRQFASTGEQTLKSPQPLGLLETTDVLTHSEVETLVKQQKIKTTGAVATKLTSLGVDPNEVELFASLTTKRIEVALPEGLLAIDESWYSQQHDYELELEVSEEAADEQLFLDLLERWQIKRKPAMNKIRRAKAAFDQAK